MGSGLAGYKTDKNFEIESIGFQPYIKSISGSVTGFVVTDRPSSFDPSNFWAYEYGPVLGSFTTRFNSSMTELIKGTADWNIISARVLKKISHKDVVEEFGERWDIWNYRIFDPNDPFGIERFQRLLESMLEENQ